MSASQITWLVFEIINYAAIILTSVGFLFQIVMILFFFLKEKKFPKSEKLARIAICIPGHNEAEVIGTTVRRMLEELDYPRDHYDVFVCAHNCTDETARLAEEAGAKVLVLDDPSQKTAGYPTDFLFKHVMKEELGYDFAIKFDADNIPDKNYLRAMNDAYQSGVEIARPFEASTNATQNTWTAVSAAYYIRDGRIACNFRERLHLDSILTGAGMMVSTKVMRECGGYDAYSRSDDTEFSLKRLCESKRIHYVADAIVYEDQPSSAKDTYARLSRMGNGINRVFWKHGFKLLGHFFVSGRRPLRPDHVRAPRRHLLPLVPPLLHRLRDLPHHERLRAVRGAGAPVARGGRRLGGPGEPERPPFPRPHGGGRRPFLPRPLYRPDLPRDLPREEEARDEAHQGNEEGRFPLLPLHGVLRLLRHRGHLHERRMGQGQEEPGFSCRGSAQGSGASFPRGIVVPDGARRPVFLFCGTGLFW